MDFGQNDAPAPRPGWIGHDQLTAYNSHLSNSFIDFFFISRLIRPTTRYTLKNRDAEFNSSNADDISTQPNHSGKPAMRYPSMKR